MSHFCRRHRSAKTTWKTGSVPLWSWPQVGRQFAPSFFLARWSERRIGSRRSRRSRVERRKSGMTRARQRDPNVVPMLSTGVEFYDITTSCVGSRRQPPQSLRRQPARPSSSSSSSGFLHCTYTVQVLYFRRKGRRARSARHTVDYFYEKFPLSSLRRSPPPDFLATNNVQ